jgi:iron(III) transport system ATP-binding protein
MPPLIALEGISKRYRVDAAPAVEALTLHLNEGEILALLGPSGCGKTTTLRLIMGFEVPDAGHIQIGDRVVAGAGRTVPPEQRGIGMVFQDYALFPHLTVGENVAFGLRRLSTDERRCVALRVLRLCELEALEERYPHELSGGQKQRVALARALAPGYPIVLLDEPLASLDADLRAQLAAHLRRLLKGSGRTAVLVTHDQAEALQIADRVGVLHHGRLEQIGTPEEIYHSPATRFVAGFIGEADFLPGTAQGDGIHTELGVLPTDRCLPAGVAVDVLLRPEAIELRPDPDGHAVVVERRFRGAGTLYAVCLGSGRHLHGRRSSAPALPLGTRVSLKTGAQPLVTFPRSQSGRDAAPAGVPWPETVSA